MVCQSAVEILSNGPTKYQTFFFFLLPGVYILQNTMVVGEGMAAGKKMKTEGVGKK